MSTLEATSLQALSYRPHIVFDDFITANGTSRWNIPSVPRHSASSSLGQISVLPLEILHLCMADFDLESLSHLARVSLRGMAAVHSFLPLTDFLKASGDIPTILAQARILGLHSLATLRTALQSQWCARCGEFAPFLHLLSAERCCYICQRLNQSLWMISVAEAGKCFHLTKEHLETLPSMWSLPAKHSIPYQKAHRRSIRLTSVRAAKEKALEVHGSIDTLQAAHPVDLDACPTPRSTIWIWYRQAPLLSSLQDPILKDQGQTRPRDTYCGMGSVHYPPQLDGQTQQERWCRACKSLRETYTVNDVALSSLTRTIPHGCNPRLYLYWMQYRAWSPAAFAQHLERDHVPSHLQTMFPDDDGRSLLMFLEHLTFSTPMLDLD